MTNDQRIDEIRERCEAATPGPWDDKLTAVYKDETAIRICGEFYNFDADAFFVAQARQDIPYLLEQLAERDKELKRLQKEVAALAIESIEREKTLAKLEAEVMVWAKAEQEGRLVVLPCKVERIKDAVQKLYESNGCLYSDIGLSHDYGDCSQGCYQCVVDGLRAEAEAALKGGTA